MHGVIGTLWPLADASALVILPALHERLASGARPEEALSEAVCAYLRTPDADDGIYYWAPLFMTSIGRLPDPIQEITQ